MEEGGTKVSSKAVIHVYAFPSGVGLHGHVT